MKKKLKSVQYQQNNCNLTIPNTNNIKNEKHTALITFVNDAINASNTTHLNKNVFYLFHHKPLNIKLITNPWTEKTIIIIN